MVQVADSIADEWAREVVPDLYYTPVYGTFTTEEIKDGDQPETESQNEDLNNNEEFKEEIKKLSKLSGTELDEEVKKIVVKVLKENMNKPNIYWKQQFVDKICKRILS